MKKKTTEQFIQQSKQKYMDRFTYESTKYKNATTKVELTCKLHGTFEVRPNDHLSGNGGCKECSNVVKITLEEFITRASLIHSNTYDYSKFIFKDMNTKGIIICANHGEFLQKPRDHIKGSGCIVCGKENSIKKQTKSLETFIYQAIDVHCGNYSYEKTVYVRSQDKITITCKIHGDFEQTPNDHLKGSGCPTCGQTLKRSMYKDKSTLLYYVKFTNNVYKIGIARSTLPQRFKGCKKPEIIKLYKFKDGAIAFDLEHLILKENRDKKYTGKYFINNYNTSCGESECFVEDISNSITSIIQSYNKDNYIQIQ